MNNKNKYCIKHPNQLLNTKENCPKCQKNESERKRKEKAKNKIGTYEYNRRKRDKLDNKLDNKLENIPFTNAIDKTYDELFWIKNLLYLPQDKNIIKLKEKIITCFNTKNKKLKINFTNLQKLIIDFTSISIFSKQCKNHKVYLIKHKEKDDACLGCIYWLDEFCSYHGKEIIQKNGKCKYCVQKIIDWRLKETNIEYRINRQEEKEKRKKGDVKNISIDIETTTDKELEKLVPKYDINFNKVADNKIRKYMLSANFKVPKIYTSTICHYEKYGNLTLQELTYKIEEIKERMKLTNNFNAELVKHCNFEKCEWPEIAHWRYSFYNERDLALFLINFCLSSVLWTQNGAKFDISFMKKMFDNIGFKQFYDYNFKNSVIQVENIFINKIAEIKEKLKNPKLKENKKEELNNELGLIMKENARLILEKIEWKKRYSLLEEEYEEISKKNKKDKKEKKEKWISNNWKKNIDLSNHYILLRDGKNRYLNFITYGEDKYQTTSKKKYITRNRSLKFGDINLLFTSSLKQKGEELTKVYQKLGMKDSAFWFLKKTISNSYKQYDLYTSNQEMINNKNDLDYAYSDTFIVMMYIYYIEKTLKTHIQRMSLTAGAEAYKQFIQSFYILLGKSFFVLGE